MRIVVVSIEGHTIPCYANFAEHFSASLLLTVVISKLVLNVLPRSCCVKLI